MSGEMYIIISILSFVLSVALIIGTFKLFGNVAKIKDKVCEEKSNIKEVWILNEMGLKDDAHKKAMRCFLSEVYGYKDSTLGGISEERIKYFEEMFALIGKEIPKGYESAYKSSKK